MGKYVSQIDKPTPAQMLALAVAVNAALRGETTNTGVLEVAAGQTEVTVQDARCRAGRLALLIPMDAAAAAVDWWLADMTRNSMTFEFSSAPGACRFGWALMGDGNIKE